MLPGVLSSFIAILALAFSIGSFWWIHARKGSLITYPIIVFGGMINNSQLQIRIPVVIHNTGARPAVIRSLQLRYKDAQGNIKVLPSQTFHSAIDPQDSHEDFAHAYVVPGRSVMTKYVRFVQFEKAQLVAGESTDFVLQILRDERKSWSGLKTLNIHTGLLTASLLTMSNDPSHWKDNTLREGRKYQEKLFS